MTAGERLVWRSPDRRVTVSWREADPVRLFIREADGSIGEVDLRDLAAILATLGLDAGPTAPGGVELGWLEAPGDVRFVIDGRRVAVAAGLELVAAGIVEAVTAFVRRLQLEAEGEPEGNDA
jgi:hypothetical protein